MKKNISEEKTGTDILFRIDLSAIPENLDLTEWLKQQGTQLFMVLHSKPENFHYHGYLKISYSEKTFRRKLTQLLPLGGNKSYSIKTKYDNLDKYLSYCLYRKGDPIKLISNDLGVDVEYLQQFIPKPAEKRPIGHVSGIQARYNDLLKLDFTDCKNPRDFTRKVLQYYKKHQIVIHLQQIRQLVLTLYLNNVEEDIAIDDITDSIMHNEDMSKITEAIYMRGQRKL